MSARPSALGSCPPARSRGQDGRQDGDRSDPVTEGAVADPADRGGSPTHRVLSEVLTA